MSCVTSQLLPIHRWLTERQLILESTHGRSDIRHARTPASFPSLALRETVVFPLTLQPLAVNRPRLDRIGQPRAGRRPAAVPGAAEQRHGRARSRTISKRIGTIAAIRQMAKAPNGGIHIIVEGLARAAADVVTRAGTSLRATVTPMPEPVERTLEVDAYVRRLQELIERGAVARERAVAGAARHGRRHRRSAAARLPAGEPARHEGRTTSSRSSRATTCSTKLQAVADALSREISLLELKSKIESQAQQEMTDAQRQYYLRQQLKAIQEELGEGEKHRSRRSFASGSPRRSCPSAVARRRRRAKSIGSSA